MDLVSEGWVAIPAAWAASDLVCSVGEGRRGLEKRRSRWWLQRDRPEQIAGWGGSNSDLWCLVGRLVRDGDEILQVPIHLSPEEALRQGVPPYA